MTNYLDGFILPIPAKHLDQYQKVAERVSEIWKEHGAISYREFVGDDLALEGTRTFPDCLNSKKDEAVIFGWVEFESKESRDLANQRVASDPRMIDLIAPLTMETREIFNAEKMVFGGFKPLVI